MIDRDFMALTFSIPFQSILINFSIFFLQLLNLSFILTWSMKNVHKYRGIETHVKRPFAADGIRISNKIDYDESRQVLFHTI